MGHHAKGIVLAVSTLLIGVSAVAQNAQKEPQMTPEQKAEMEAYAKAGTPGAATQGDGRDGGHLRPQDQELAGARQPPDGGDRHRHAHRWRSTAACWSRRSQRTMMGQPFTGHGMQGYDNVDRQVLVDMERQHVHRPDGQRRHLRRQAEPARSPAAGTIRSRRPGDVAHDDALDQPDHRGLRDVRARARTARKCR